MRGYNFDADLELHDGAAAITADGVGQVDSAAAIRDVGGSGLARFEGVAVVEISACDDASGDETYDIQIRGSAASNMGSPQQLGSVTVTRGTTGRVEIPFTNAKQGTNYRYIDANFDVGGTTPSITCKIYVAPLDWC